MTTFGANLRKLREEKGLSAKEIARNIGVSTSTYRDWEYGRKILGEPYLKLAQALGVSLNRMFMKPLPKEQKILRELETIKNSLRRLEKEFESFF